MLDQALTASEGFVSEYALGLKEPKMRLSRPAPKRSLGATVTRIERPIRAAIEQLNRVVALDSEVFDAIFDCTVYGPGAFREPTDLRLSWFLVMVNLTNAFTTGRSTTTSFHASLEWFFGNAETANKLLSCFPVQQIEAAEIELKKLTINADLFDLLPYVVEPHGHVTRNDVETCEVAQVRRGEKKVSGVYYTPSDVADFMVQSISEISAKPGSWIDPACGTGVFLRAAISHLKVSAPLDELCLNELVLSTIYGIDKSALTTDLATFVVFLDCGVSESKDTYFNAWQRIKKNIVCMDALRLAPRDSALVAFRDRSQVVEVQQMFPHVGNNGFGHVVMNPPYATTRIDGILQSTWHSYSDITLGQNGDLHLAFVEMLWRLTSNDGTSAAVLPLSIGANTTRSYLRLRQELIRTPSKKEFLFFDREPQALFGEDIKTRNLILIQQNSSASRVWTSRLLKWTAEQRPTIFTRDRLVEIDAAQCRTFIPKVETPEEEIAYRNLRAPDRLKKAIQHSPRKSRLTLNAAASTDDELRKRMLLVAGTAYNFINCFYADALALEPSKSYSTSPVNVLLFDSEQDAAIAFALISSRLCYWLWHVEGDGFHLTGDFLSRLPLWSVWCSPELKEILAEHGRRLWDEAKETKVGAINGGKQTYSFHCGYSHQSARDVERMLIQHLDLEENFSESLNTFIQASVSIDGSDRLQRINSKLRKVL